MRALLDGRFAEAERLAQQALEFGQQAQVENADGVFGIQMFLLRREQGRLAELAPPSGTLSGNTLPRPGALAWR